MKWNDDSGDAVGTSLSLTYPALPGAVICRINEEKFITQYVKLTGAPESLARNIYMLLEPAFFQAFP